MAYIYGGTSGTLNKRKQGHGQVLTGVDGELHQVVGDAHTLSGRARGGDDTITGGGAGAVNGFDGDAFAMLEGALAAMT